MVSLLPFIGSVSTKKATRSAKSEDGRQPSGLLTMVSNAQKRRNSPEQADSPLPRGPNRVFPGAPMPHVVLPTVQGGKLEIGAPTGRWQLIVVYRGKHCPVSKNFLASLQQIVFELDELAVEVVAVSGDGRERAESFVEALKTTTEAKEVTFKIAYGLPLPEMLKWGLYISTPRSLRETDQPFPEPALFVLNPDGEVHIVEYSNSPFARPDLRILVEGKTPLVEPSITSRLPRSTPLSLRLLCCAILLTSRLSWHHVKSRTPSRVVPRATCFTPSPSAPVVQA